jgi:hypothetical protein
VLLWILTPYSPVSNVSEETALSISGLDCVGLGIGWIIQSGCKGWEIQTHGWGGGGDEMEPGPSQQKRGHF